MSLKNDAMNEQLNLPIRVPDSASLDNFFVGRNEEAVSALQQWLEPITINKVLYFYGASGSGCSHLLQAACQFLSDRNELTVYVPSSDSSITNEFIAQLSPSATVCVDDLDAVAGQLNWEESLLELYERLLPGGGRLLFSGSQPPLAVGLKLADLATRLAAGEVYRIQALTESELPRAMLLRAKRRGFELSDEVIHYLLRRMPRNSKAIFDVLDRLDKAAFAKQRRITIPFLQDMEKDGS